jgi:methyl-accepting chemotaxis protein
MTVSINHVSDRAGEAHHLTQASGQQANESGGVIQDTTRSIQAIADVVAQAAHQIETLRSQSDTVTAVVSVIKEVADQTNLLALNAAIEAARAGEQGRGFAVVADEVRKLAERTAHSTQEISSTIQAMQNGAETAAEQIRNAVTQVENGVSKAQSADDAVAQIRNSADDAVRVVGDIALAIKEQSMASNNIARQVETIAQMTEENSSAAQQSASYAQQLEALAAQMQGIVQQYRI